MNDTVRQYQLLQTEIDEAIHKVLESGYFILGPNVTHFENEAAQYLGVKHAIAVASGTDALHLALLAAGIGEGDEVITTAFTFIGTAEAISYTGAQPVFVDIDNDTFNIDVKQIEASITPKTKAVIAVHLFGQAAELDALRTICKKHQLKLIEDCAQSFGSDYHSKKTGSFGDLGCFSFYPSKNLGAFGDGGMVVTDNDDLAETIRVLRNHGSREPYHHSIIGYNSRLDELQATILRVKLKYIDKFNEQRQQVAYRYNKQLLQTSLITPVEIKQGSHVYHQYTVRCDMREVIQSKLAGENIASAVYYPIPLHQQDVYKTQCHGVSLPVTESAASQVLSLPIYPDLSVQQIDRICQCIIELEIKFKGVGEHANTNNSNLLPT